MSDEERISGVRRTLRRLRRSVGGRLFLLLSGSLVVALSLLGYLNLRLHQSDLEDLTLLSADNVSEVIKDSTAFHMLRNDREALDHTIATIGAESGVDRIRIFNREGRISFSTNRAEVGTFVDTTSEACDGCHADVVPEVELDPSRRFRIYDRGDQRLVRVINPIHNNRTCSEASCHAHPSSQRVLGVLDTSLSLAYADQHLSRSNLRVMTFSAFGIVCVTILCALFIWRVVNRPVRELYKGTKRLQTGELGYQAKVSSNDQIGELVVSFNKMSRELQEAQLKQAEWNRTLEERIREKSAELKEANHQMLQAEKLTSLGKLAAVVAHEINNPLTGILTYARLIRRWMEKEKLDPAKTDEIIESLTLIETESRRCGDLVRELLAFARPTPMNIQPVDLNAVVKQSLRLAEHRIQLSSISLETSLCDELPRIEGDPSQLQQLLIALLMNAIDAMPKGGCLSVTTRRRESDEVQVVIEDNGVGIPDEVRSRLFEPFVTTKEDSRGVGLGLAISKQIVERHAGRISVESESGHGTKFTIDLPPQLRRRPPEMKAAI